MFRLSLHIGPLHLDVAIGDDPEWVDEGTSYPTMPTLFSQECVNTFEAMADEYVNDWDE